MGKTTIVIEKMENCYTENLEIELRKKIIFFSIKIR
jgi:hypothetical protein